MDSTFFFSNIYNPSIDTWCPTRVNSIKKSTAGSLMLDVQIHDELSQELYKAITGCMKFCQLAPENNALISIEKIRFAFILKNKRYQNHLRNLEHKLMQLTKEKPHLRAEIAKVSSQIEIVDEMVAHNVDLEWTNETLMRKLASLKNSSIETRKLKPEYLNALSFQNLNFEKI
ncbi:hypothetical protein ZYGM_003042 [Zygosaccharomyces mellis]|uniref:Uncharacterized protein n=1 Tax=Zygosaccharomyces mellis TaxID=42258 RepID=A0A4C2E3H5_9SACH|nr:hypothetical protein ZYGM_003042 [Zygosaccharomyces mellis]